MKRILLASTLIFATAFDAAALPLSLNDCIERAVRDNRVLKSAEMESVATAESAVISRAGFFPAVRMRAFYTLVDQPGRLIVDRNSFGINVPPETVEVATNDQDFYSLGLSVEQTIFTGGRLTHTYRKAQVSSEETTLQEERERESLVFRVKRGFYDALNARLQREVAEKVAESKKERLRVLQELHGEGYVQREDVLRQEVDVAFAELETTKGANKEELALSNLRQLIYLPEREDIMLTGMPHAVAVIAPLEEIKRHAVENRKELKIAGARIRGAEEDVSIAKSAYYPQASLQGSYMRQKETNITRNDLWLFTANLDWSIFEWGKTAAEVRQKAAQKQRLQYLREDNVLTTSLEVERAWRSIRELEKGLSAHEKRVRMAEYIAGQMAERHTEGAVKLVDVIEAESEFLKEFNDYIAVANDLNSAVASLELAGSGALPDWFETRSLYIPAVNSRSSLLKSSVVAMWKPVAVSTSEDSVRGYESQEGGNISYGDAGRAESELEELLR